MSGEIKRANVDWVQANCRGVNTDLFYMEEDYLKNKFLTQKQVRRVCYGCPIRMECLKVGFAFERYGMWGGVSALERMEIANGDIESRFLNGLKKDVIEFGGSFNEIVEASKVERALM